MSCQKLNKLTLYKHLINVIVTKVSLDKKISRKEILRTLGIVFHVSDKRDKEKIINELREGGILVRENKQFYSINF